MLDTVKDTLGTFACNTRDFGKRVGSGTVDLAYRIGLKRGLIGAAIAAAAVGGTIVLVRYLKARDESDTELDNFDEELPKAARTQTQRRRNSATYAR